MSEIIVRRADASEIRDLRHRVLRAGLPPEEAIFDGDDDPETFHAAAVTAESQVVGCATIMRSQWNGAPAWRLRGMAVDPSFRRFGIGRRLLAVIDAHVREHPPLVFWCNARTPAIEFYRSLGWTRHGEQFDIPTAGPHYVMSKHL